MIFAGADWRSTHPAPHPAVSRGSCCAGTVSTPIATCSASYEPRVTTRWICGAFATVRSMRPTWAAHYRPNRSPARRAFRSLSWVGDHFQIPTVGIAVDPTRIPLDNPALQALVRANQRALLTIAEQPQLAVDYIASFLDRLTRDEVQRYYERYIGPYFTSDGRVDLNVAQHAVDAVATELGVAAASVDQDVPARPVTAAATTQHSSHLHAGCQIAPRKPCQIAGKLTHLAACPLTYWRNPNPNRQFAFSTLS